ncbi:DUF1682 domain-containing protein, partial [Fagus crenata]
MAKKRKSVATSLGEVDRTMYASCSEFLYPNSPPLTQSDPEPTRLTPPDPNPDPNPNPGSHSNSHSSSSDPPKPSTSTSGFDYWDEDEFEGLPIIIEDKPLDSETKPNQQQKPVGLKSFTVEIVCVTFLIMFLINYFTGKHENENLALAWVAKFATHDSIFDRNFSLLGCTIWLCR